MAKKKAQPQVFTLDDQVAYAYSPADEVRLTFNGWRERKDEPAPAATATATADAGTVETDSKATKSAPKKAS